MLADTTPQKSEEKKEIVLMRKSQVSGLSPLGKPKLGPGVVKQDGQVAKNTGGKIIFGSFASKFYIFFKTCHCSFEKVINKHI